MSGRFSVFKPIIGQMLRSKWHESEITRLVRVHAEGNTNVCCINCHQNLSSNCKENEKVELKRQKQGSIRGIWTLPLGTNDACAKFHGNPSYPNFNQDQICGSIRTKFVDRLSEKQATNVTETEVCFCFILLSCQPQGGRSVDRPVGLVCIRFKALLPGGN